MNKPRFNTFAWAAAVLTFCASAAQANAVRYGNTNPALAGNPLLRGNATAYDSINKVYLVVAAHGVVYGRFVGSDGVPIAAPNGAVQFAIQVATANWGAFPRAAFSPDADGGAGAFLVTWTESDAVSGIPFVKTRLVSFTHSGAFGADNIVGANLGSPAAWANGEQGNAIAYSSASKLFLMAYTRVAYSNLTAYRLNLQGLAIDQVAIPKLVAGEGERDPSVAYDPDDNQFLITYAGWGAAGAFVRGRRVDAATGTLLDASPIPIYASSGTFITDTAYNTAAKSYLSAWYSGASLGRVVKPDGTLPGPVIVLSTRWFAYDALSVAYNARSDTFFMVSHSSDWEDGGVEIKSDGNPVDNGFRVTSTPVSASGNFYPRISANADRPEWLMSSAYSLSTGMVQLVAGTAIGPPPSQPMMSLDTPRSGAVLPNFTVAGWAIDRSSVSGTGIDSVSVFATPVGGSPLLLGTATLGFARPDVADAFHGAQFTNSGYSFTVGGLWPGTYDITVKEHSTLGGTTTSGPTVRVTLKSFMTIDTPVPGAKVGTYLLLGGWAIDGAATGGSGIDAVHVWAYPNPGSGQDPIFMGAAELNVPRPDVAAAFGDPRYANCGYNLFLWGLSSGTTYDLVTYAHSAATGAWDYRIVRVTVSTFVVIDPIVPSSTTPFIIKGWALDRAASSGTGVDAVHVYAYPAGSSSPLFLGVATYGLANAATTSLFGSQFANAGFSLTATLSAGTYDVVAFAHTTVDGTFRGATITRIIVP
ncbi:MAG: hypothetical protein DMF85_06400 [Acidobacteria bacterium]|nr:MAG: hypothetical protein DMF85_06400 [Acidobacteriota bacterium]